MHQMELETSRLKNSNIERVKKYQKILGTLLGIEPRTFRLLDGYSYHLSYWEPRKQAILPAIALVYRT